MILLIILARFQYNITTANTTVYNYSENDDIFFQIPIPRTAFFVHSTDNLIISVNVRTCENKQHFGFIGAPTRSFGVFFGSSTGSINIHVKNDTLFAFSTMFIPYECGVVHMSTAIEEKFDLFYGVGSNETLVPNRTVCFWHATYSYVNTTVDLIQSNESDTQFEFLTNTHRYSCNKPIDEELDKNESRPENPDWPDWKPDENETWPWWPDLKPDKNESKPEKPDWKPDKNHSKPDRPTRPDKPEDDKDKENDKEKDQGNDKDKDKENDKEKDQGNDKENDKDKDKENDKDKDKENDKEKDQGNDKEKDQGNDKEKDQGNDKENDKEQDQGNAKEDGKEYDKNGKGDKKETRILKMKRRSKLRIMQETEPENQQDKPEKPGKKLGSINNIVLHGGGKFEERHTGNSFMSLHIGKQKDSDLSLHLRIFGASIPPPIVQPSEKPSGKPRPSRDPWFDKDPRNHQVVQNHQNPNPGAHQESFHAILVPSEQPQFLVDEEHFPVPKPDHRTPSRPDFDFDFGGEDEGANEDVVGRHRPDPPQIVAMGLLAVCFVCTIVIIICVAFILTKKRQLDERNARLALIEREKEEIESGLRKLPHISKATNPVPHPALLDGIYDSRDTVKERENDGSALNCESSDGKL